MPLEEEQEAEVRDLVGRLERKLPRQGAHLMVQPGLEGGGLVGNQLGYLRLGVELLRASLDPAPASEGTPMQVKPDLASILAEGERTLFEGWELDESIVSRAPIQSRLGAIGQLVAGAVMVGLVLLALLGVFLVLRFIFVG
jgi:hypothetical protein